MSSIIDWNDRSTCILFGDGAGAVILQKNDNAMPMSFEMQSDGTYSDILYTQIEGKTQQTLKMNGRSVFRHATEKLHESTLSVLKKAGKTINDITWFIPHQANNRIIDAVALKLSVPPEKCISTVGIHANTSAASIPLALDHSNKESKFKKGDLIASAAIGGGLCWGSILFEW
uniref:Beta-ketoacyl-[acyl-carrier-protein] synthase III C-terminal domain-containing protein n=1 Tax=Biomphalaria glabrata TaxID=6526 RepID=A0A2C9M3E3_BIOGL